MSTLVKNAHRPPSPNLTSVSQLSRKCLSNVSFVSPTSRQRLERLERLASVSPVSGVFVSKRQRLACKIRTILKRPSTSVDVDPGNLSRRQEGALQSFALSNPIQHLHIHFHNVQLIFKPQEITTSCLPSKYYLLKRFIKSPRSFTNSLFLSFFLIIAAFWYPCLCRWWIIFLPLESCYSSRHSLD